MSSNPKRFPPNFTTKAGDLKTVICIVCEAKGRKWEMLVEGNEAFAAYHNKKYHTVPKPKLYDWEKYLRTYDDVKGAERLEKFFWPKD